MERIKNEVGETQYFNFEEANLICSYYQWLTKGFKFVTPYGNLTIDKVLPMKNSNGKYTPMVLHDAFAPNEVPEFFEYKCLANYLIDYLKYMEIPLFPIIGSDVLCDICNHLPPPSPKDENGIDLYL